MTHFPLVEVRAALKLKVLDLTHGHTGPIIAVLYSAKYHKPMLTFCTGPRGYA